MPDSLAIYWAWNGDGHWDAPDNPRWEYASNQALYKLYVVRRLASDDEAHEAEAAEDFIRQFVPEVERVLAAGTSEDRATGGSASGPPDDLPADGSR